MAGGDPPTPASPSVDELERLRAEWLESHGADRDDQEVKLCMYETALVRDAAWLLREAREADRLRAEAPIDPELQVVVPWRIYSKLLWRVNALLALESALAPLISGEVTPERVRAAVSIYMRAEEVIAVYADTGSADGLLSWLRDFAAWEQGK